MKIILNVGEEISLIISSNYTTGYSWDFNKETEVLKIERNVLDTKSSPTMFGAPLSELVKFKAISQGYITYTFKPQWSEDTNDIEKTITIEII